MVQLAALELDAGNAEAAIPLAEGGYRALVEAAAGEDEMLAAKNVLGDALASAGRSTRRSRCSRR
ncbi:MAG: hypothetical protein ACRD03_06215 [Acidimicrobiales bacterium]